MIHDSARPPSSSVYDKAEARLELPTAFRMRAPSVGVLHAESVAPAASVRYAPGPWRTFVRALRRALVLAVALACVSGGTAYARRGHAPPRQAPAGHGPREPSTLARATQAARVKARAAAHHARRAVKARTARHHHASRGAKSAKKHPGAG
jgi:hypothetical protein